MRLRVILEELAKVGTALAAAESEAAMPFDIGEQVGYLTGRYPTAFYSGQLVNFLKDELAKCLVRVPSRVLFKPIVDGFVAKFVEALRKAQYEKRVLGQWVPMTGITEQTAEVVNVLYPAGELRLCLIAETKLDADHPLRRWPDLMVGGAYVLGIGFGLEYDDAINQQVVPLYVRQDWLRSMRDKVAEMERATSVVHPTKW